MEKDKVEINSQKLKNSGLTRRFYLFYNKVRSSSELSVHECGWEKCLAKHSYGPSVRRYFILHYIVKGKGFYKIAGKKYEFSENQAFIIPPDVETYYEADENEPWHYYWVDFHGSEAINLLKIAGFFDDKNQENYYYNTAVDKEVLLSNLETMCQYSSRTIKTSYFMLGHLYLILSALFNSKNPEEGFKAKNYIDEAIRFIEKLYAEY